jgi:hypothetical protein
MIGTPWCANTSASGAGVRAIAGQHSDHRVDPPRFTAAVNAFDPGADVGGESFALSLIEQRGRPLVLNEQIVQIDGPMPGAKMISCGTVVGDAECVCFMPVSAGRSLAHQNKVQQHAGHHGPPRKNSAIAPTPTTFCTRLPPSPAAADVFSMVK